MAQFEKSISYVLANEGGWSDDPNDVPTNFGITQNTLCQWRGKPVGPEDVRNLSLAEAQRIYNFWYWNPLSLNSCKSQNVATAIFDIGVNQGLHAAAMSAQIIVNDHAGVKIKVDGMLGPISMQGINMVAANLFIEEFEKQTVEAYNEIVERNPGKQIYLHGWLNRARKLLSLLVVENAPH